MNVNTLSKEERKLIDYIRTHPLKEKIIKQLVSTIRETSVKNKHKK